MRWRPDDETIIYSRQNNLSERLLELEQEGVLTSPCQFFYVVVAPEYRAHGNVPPLLYVDRMMQFAGRKYYVALMSAVDIYRSEAAPDSDDFTVMVIGERMTLGRRKKRPVKFYARQNDVSSEVLRVETAFGQVNVSSPLLTALDLVQKESEVGGLARVAEALTVIADEIEFGVEKSPVLLEFPTAVIQRLGYLLDAVQAHSRASELYRLCADSGMTFRPTPLNASSSTGIGFETDDRWKVIVNNALSI